MKDHWAKRLISVSDRVYCVLLKIFPTEFRREYGALIARAFHNLSREAYAERGLIGVAWLWIPSAADVIGNAIAEQLETPGRIAMKLLRNRLEPLGSFGKWVIATGVGLYVGWGLNLVIRPLLVLGRIDMVWSANDLETVYANLDLTGFFLLAVLSGLITGAIVGLFQWLALLRKTGDLGLWIPATAIGFGIDFLLKAVLFLVDYSERYQFPLQPGSLVPLLFVITPFLGAFLIGLSQWLVLRRRVRFSGLWLLVMPIATIPTITLIPEIDALYGSLKAWIMRLAPTMPVGVIPLTKLVYPLPYLFEGIIVGAVTGIVIVMLVRQSTERSHVPVANDLRPVNS